MAAESPPRATARRPQRRQATARPHTTAGHGATTTGTAPDQPRRVEQPPTGRSALGEQAHALHQRQAAPGRPRAPRRVACLTRPAAPRPKAARCAVLRRATKSECAPVENPETCMSPAKTWTSIMDCPAAGAVRWNARIIPGSSPSAEAAATFNIPTCITAMNTAIGLTTNMGGPMTGSTRAIPITAFT